MKKLLFMGGIQRCTSLQFKATLFVCFLLSKTSLSQVPQNPISDGNGTPVIYYDPFFDKQCAANNSI